jgi:hypothetical protein
MAGGTVTGTFGRPDGAEGPAIPCTDGETLRNLAGTGGGGGREGSRWLRGGKAWHKCTCELLGPVGSSTRTPNVHTQTCTSHFPRVSWTRKYYTRGYANTCKYPEI